MTIDFHTQGSAGTYAARTADPGWAAAIARIAPPQGLRVADIGCGGGIYSTALARMGAAHVTGIDFSARMVQDARDRAAALGVANVAFAQGEAERTDLPTGGVDLVLERALIHHLPSLEDAFAEARRILRPGGVLLIQDRTMDDVLAPPSAEHLRGWFFALFPRLADVEADRRPAAEQVEVALSAAGFSLAGTHRLTELRRTYGDVDALRADLMARTGRSILHALDDEELARLTERICREATVGTAAGEPVREVDHWTLWEARVPLGA